jgi:hypothetical protein
LREAVSKEFLYGNTLRIGLGSIVIEYLRRKGKSETLQNKGMGV